MISPPYQKILDPPLKEVAVEVTMNQNIVVHDANEDADDQEQDLEQDADEQERMYKNRTQVIR